MTNISVTRHRICDRSSFDTSSSSSYPTSFFFLSTTMALPHLLTTFILFVITIWSDNHPAPQKRNIWWYNSESTRTTCIPNANVESILSVLSTKAYPCLPHETFTDFNCWNKSFQLRPLLLENCKNVTAVNCHPSSLLITQVCHYLPVTITDPQTLPLGCLAAWLANKYNLPPLPSLRVGPTDTN